MSITSIPSPAQADKPVTEVVVQNTAANPVPMTGQVSITNTPSVALLPGARVAIDPASNNVVLANTAPIPVRDVTESLEHLHLQLNLDS
jgi:hypothetical protein